MILRSASGVAALALVAAPSAVHADMPVDAPAAFDVDRLRATATPLWAGLEDARALGLGHLAGSITVSMVSRPITLVGTSGEALPPPVDWRATISAAVSYGVTETVELMVAAPMVLQDGDRLTAVGDGRELRATTIGDVAIGAKMQVVEREHLAVAVSGVLGLPSGNEQHFAGETSWTADWRGLALLQYGRVGVAAGAGVKLRGEEVRLAGNLVAGNEVNGAIAVGVAVPPIAGLWCGFDQVRVIGELTGTLGDDVGGERGPSPVEARGGVRVRLWRGWTIGVIGGAGLVDEVGSPRWRAGVDVSWTDAPRGDWDGDGDADRDDKCALGEC